jgi:hypothetical protein
MRVVAPPDHLVVLGQSLGPTDWLAIAAIVTANAVSVSAGGRSRRRVIGSDPARVETRSTPIMGDVRPEP